MDIINSLFSSYLSAFDPAKDIPSLEGKTIIVTGGNAGIGKAQLTYLVAHTPGKLYLAARSQSKAQAAIQDIRKVVPNCPDIHVLELDLTSLESVNHAARSFLHDNDRLDVLINNAGISSFPPGLTKDGYEIQFGTNYMGHFLFTRQLLPLMLKTAAAANSDVRIVNLSSAGHQWTIPGGWQPEICTTDMAQMHTVRRYGQSKLANVLFTRELARRYPSITSVSLDPGATNTNLTVPLRNSNIFLKVFLTAFTQLFQSPAKGALNPTWAMVAPVETDNDKQGQKRVPKVKSGEYYVPVGKWNTGSAPSRDMELGKRLWEWSEDEVKKKGY